MHTFSEWQFVNHFDGMECFIPIALLHLYFSNQIDDRDLDWDSSQRHWGKLPLRQLRPHAITTWSHVEENLHTRCMMGYSSIPSTLGRRTHIYATTWVITGLEKKVCRMVDVWNLNEKSSITMSTLSYHPIFNCLTTILLKVQRKNSSPAKIYCDHVNWTKTSVDCKLKYKRGKDWNPIRKKNWRKCKLHGH